MGSVRLRLVAALAAALLLAGCGSTSGTSDASPTRSFDPLANPTAMPAVIAAKFPATPMVRHVYLSDSVLSLEVRDPKKPENLDTYRYNGEEWTSTPVSVSMSEIRELEQRTFPVTAIAWDRIPALMQQAMDGLDLEGETISGVSYDKLVGDPPRVYIGVQGLRGTGRLLGNADGTNIEVARN